MALRVRVAWKYIVIIARLVYEVEMEGNGRIYEKFLSFLYFFFHRCITLTHVFVYVCVCTRTRTTGERESVSEIRGLESLQEKYWLFIEI